MCKTVSHVFLVGAVFMLAAVVSGCSPMNSEPTKDTYVEVPDRDWALWDDHDGVLVHWNSTSYVRADAPKLTYKQLTFHPPLEQEQMAKKIDDLKLGKILKQVDENAHLTLLRDGRVLSSGGGVPLNFQPRPISDLVILDPISKTSKRITAGLRVPRTNHTVVELKDGRVIFIGGETTKEFADDGSDNITNTVEQLDLQTGQTTVIGRFMMARHDVVAEVVGDRDILLEGGWNQRSIARDERWWPGAEIFRVPEKEKIGDR